MSGFSWKESEMSSDGTHHLIGGGDDDGLCSLHLLATTGERERTLEEYYALLEAAQI